MPDKSDRSARGVFDELLGTWKSVVTPDDTGAPLEDGFIDVHEIREVSPTKGIITRGERRPPGAGGTGGGQFSIAGSKVQLVGINFLVILRRQAGGNQRYTGLTTQGTGEIEGDAVFVVARARRPESQEEGTWVATKQG